MSSSSLCNVCRGTGDACPRYCTDLNRTIPICPEPPSRAHGGQHELQFFGHDDSDAWLFNDPKSTDPQHEEMPPVVSPAFNYFDSFREACNPAHGLTFDVCLTASSPPDSIPPSTEGSSMGLPATSAAIVSGWIFLISLEFYDFELIGRLLLLVLVEWVVFFVDSLFR